LKFGQVADGLGDGLELVVDEDPEGIGIRKKARDVK
jgi:hypothetical protein